MLMEYVKLADKALSWGISERMARAYCAQGRVPGAELRGKTWFIPADAIKPVRANARAKRPLLVALRQEKEMGLRGGIYHRMQIDLAYNSNHIEGSTLTHDQTRHIFETATLLPDVETPLRVDDIVEAANHFRAFDMVIDRAGAKLTTSFIKGLHRMLKQGTSDADKSWFAVGDWKRMPNEVGGRETCPPADVDASMRALVAAYEERATHTLDDLLDFHVSFERIHPFQDGNGRVGRLILVKECLRNEIVPFIIGEETKLFYYRGLARWDEERGWLRDTCLAAQDAFLETLRYFEIDGV